MDRANDKSMQDKAYYSKLNGACWLPCVCWGGGRFVGERHLLIRINSFVSFKNIHNSLHRREIKYLGRRYGIQSNAWQMSMHVQCPIELNISQSQNQCHSDKHQFKDISSVRLKRLQGCISNMVTFQESHFSNVYMWVLHEGIWVWYPRGPKGALDLLELDFQVVVGHHEHAGNQIWILCKIKCS